MPTEKIDLGDLIEALYHHFLEETGNEEKASALTADTINRLLADPDDLPPAYMAAA